MKQRTVATANARQQGYTLVELMISMAIGLVVIGAILAVYLSTSSTSRQSTAATRMSEDAAIVMALMGNYLRVAGYSPPRVLVSPGSAKVNDVNVTATDRRFTGLAIRGCDNGFKNATVKFDDLACETTAAVGMSAVALRFEGDLDSTLPAGGKASDCLTNPVEPLAESARDKTVLYPLIDSRLFVATSPTNGTPEFYCAGNGIDIAGKQFTPKPLVQFVDGLFITYGIADDVVERNVTSYVSQTQLDALGAAPAAWGRVISLKLCVVMRSQSVASEGGGNYIACDGTSVASAGGFARRAFTSTFTLRNRGDFAGT
jgi:type IV pilus assembly protein PilW